MDKQTFIEKIKKEGFWEYVDFYKKWNDYNTYLVGVNGKDGDFGLDQIILEKNNKYRYATIKENLKIQGLL